MKQKPIKHHLDYRREGGELKEGLEYRILGCGRLTRWSDGSKVLKFFKDKNNTRISIQLYKGIYHCKVEVFTNNGMGWDSEEEVSANANLHEAMKQLRRNALTNPIIVSKINIKNP